MSGIYGGVQALLKNDHPYSIYIHCMSHRLNLALVHACKSSEFGNDFFALLQSLFNMFSHPLYNSKYKNICKTLGIQPLAIHQLSDTRWSCRYFTVKSVFENFNALIDTLTEISKSKDEIKFQANGLIIHMKSTEFKISLKFFHSILSIVHTTHKALQSETATLFSSMNLIMSAIQHLKSLRTDAEFEKFFEPFESDLLTKRRRTQKTFADSIVDSTTGFHEPIEKDNMKNQLYFLILDQLISELETRFPVSSFNIAQACSNLWLFQSQDIKPLVDMYNSIFTLESNSIDLNLLNAQIDIAKLEMNNDFSEAHVQSVV